MQALVKYIEKLYCGGTVTFTTVVAAFTLFPRFSRTRVQGCMLLPAFTFVFLMHWSQRKEWRWNGLDCWVWNPVLWCTGWNMIMAVARVEWLSTYPWYQEELAIILMGAYWVPLGGQGWFKRGVEHALFLHVTSIVINSPSWTTVTFTCFAYYCCLVANHLHCMYIFHQIQKSLGHSYPYVAFEHQNWLIMVITISITIFFSLFPCFEYFMVFVASTPEASQSLSLLILKLRVGKKTSMGSS